MAVGDRCEFMQYHAPHNYRNIHGNPLRCEGLQLPRGMDERRSVLTDVVVRLEGFRVDPDVIEHFRTLRDA